MPREMMYDMLRVDTNREKGILRVSPSRLAGLARHDVILRNIEVVDIVIETQTPRVLPTFASDLLKVAPGLRTMVLTFLSEHRHAGHVLPLFSDDELMSNVQVCCKIVDVRRNYCFVR